MYSRRERNIVLLPSLYIGVYNLCRSLDPLPHLLGFFFGPYSLFSTSCSLPSSTDLQRRVWNVSDVSAL